MRSLSTIPERWNFADFAPDDGDGVFDLATFTDSFTKQLLQYLNQRHGRTEPESAPSVVEVDVPATAVSCEVRRELPIQVFGSNGEVVATSIN